MQLQDRRPGVVEWLFDKKKPDERIPREDQHEREGEQNAQRPEGGAEHDDERARDGGNTDRANTNRPHFPPPKS
jgi:hypothetical protein